MSNELKVSQQQCEAVRLWDSQWVNIVNAPEVLNADSREDAVNIAVRLTEKAIAENAAKDTHPPKPVVSGQAWKARECVYSVANQFDAHRKDLPDGFQDWAAEISRDLRIAYALLAQLAKEPT